MKSKNLAFLLLLSLFGARNTIATIKNEPLKNYSMTYELSMPEPNTHYFEVKIALDLMEKTKSADFVFSIKSKAILTSK